MKIAVTGATGYIGEKLAKCAVFSGHKVVALTRRRPKFVVCDWIPYDLSSKQAPVIAIGTDVVLHLATTPSAHEQQNGDQEISAAILLIKAAQDIGAKFIFVSSQTARPDAPTTYGRTKWNIERHVLAAGGWVVRPGQVYGGTTRGLFGELVKTVQRLPVLPAFRPPPRVQPIHVDDLVQGLLRLAERDGIAPGVLCLASPKSVTFTKFLRVIACNRLRLWRIVLPVPTVLISVGIRLVGTQTGFARLNSLFELQDMDTVLDLQRLGLQLRPLTSGMHPSGSDNRRRLLVEGRALLFYVLSESPSSTVLRRYVRAIEKLRDRRVLHLPNLFASWPNLLALINSDNRTDSSWEMEFVWRLDAATVLAEASPQGAKQFLGTGKRCGLAKSIFGIAHAVAAELVWRTLSVLLTPVTRMALSRTLSERR